LLKKACAVTQDIDFFRQILEGLTNSVLLLDRDLRVSYINPSGEMLFESSAQRLLGTEIGELINGANQLKEEIKQAQVSGQPFAQRGLELTVFNRRVVTTDFVVTPLTDTKEKSPGKRMVLIELFASHRGDRISRDEHQAVQSNAIRAMIRGLAHEIKNPLGGLRGAAQLLERELQDEELKEFTNIIIGEADRLRNLVNSLLGPNKPTDRRSVNIHEITERVSQLINADKPPTVELVHDYDPSIPEIEADSDQLIQAILNITVNAVIAVGERGVITIRTRTKRQVTIGHIRHKLVCQIDIIDNGPGVPEEMLETIFFPMVTSRADGSGLGLSISQSLVQQHGGVITCNSESGHTVFSVILPVNNS